VIIMAVPEVVVTEPAGEPFAPGSTVQFSWTVSDADNRTITYEWSGQDGQGNPLSGTGELAIVDSFTMQSFTLGGTPLTIDNVAMTATGTVPAA
jgi:hypothetical protein